MDMLHIIACISACFMGGAENNVQTGLPHIILFGFAGTTVKRAIAVATASLRMEK
jgi:hypothetical protein